jgi:hypothetical protein
MKKILLAILVLCPFVLVFIPKNSPAIPAFARKYKTSCVLCHAPFPRLTAMGQAFRDLGYRLPEADEVYVKDEPVSLGAEPYKKMFPDSVWPSDIPGMPPVSIFILGDVTQDLKNGKNTHFNLPSEGDILAGGTFGKDFSFWAEFDFEKNDDSTDTNVQAWLMWSNLFSDYIGEKRLNVKGGNVGKYEIALPNNANENRLSVEDYLYATALNLDTEPGFEVNGFGQHWRYYAGIVQTDTTNNNKGFYGGLSVKLGGLGYDGIGGASEKGGVGTSPSGYWRDDAVYFGLFGYRTYEGSDSKSFNRIGGDTRLTYKDFDFGGGYIYGHDNETDVKENICFAGVQYWLFPWVMPYVRYEYLWSSGSDNTLDQGRFVVGSAVLIRANIKITAEGVFYTKNEPRDAGISDDDDHVTFQLAWAF